ncbi:Gamma-tubulin complex component 4 [Dionaea muscipula]
MELEKSWASMMHQDHSDLSKRRMEGLKGFEIQKWKQHIGPMWHVREHMAFLIRNLQFYIQVDVIESQWNVLQAHIEDSHDFTELVNFHQEYVIIMVYSTSLWIVALHYTTLGQLLHLDLCTCLLPEIHVS